MCPFVRCLVHLVSIYTHVFWWSEGRGAGGQQIAGAPLECRMLKRTCSNADTINVCAALAFEGAIESLYPDDSLIDFMRDPPRSTLAAHAQEALDQGSWSLVCLRS